MDDHTLVYGYPVSKPPLGRLFPSGGPVDLDMIIGRGAEIRQIVTMLNQGVHILVAGDRRIGKTTVCQAACEILRREHAIRIIAIDVPESSNSLDLCQLLVDRCRTSGLAAGRRLLGATTPLVEKLLASHGIPLNLSALRADALPTARRAILGLPLQIAATSGPTVLFFDELQRIANYDDGDEIIHDLRDLYAGQDSVMILVDGSHQRTFDRLLGSTDGLGKLVHRIELSPTIPRREWRTGLTDRFDQAEHPIEREALEALLDFGAEQPYRTMTAARFAALTAQTLGGETDAFCVRDGIDTAKRQLSDDGL